MAETLSRYALYNRYQITGKLEMQTAFHIGGGGVTISNSDNPVVLTPERVPFIPGSSFKGAFRSTVEKLVNGLPTSLWACSMEELSSEEIKQARSEKRPICSTERPKEIAQKRREANQDEARKILEGAREDLCDTCKLFGSPFAAARLSINDLYLDGEWSEVIERRDGVAIDRDSEKAKDRLKYDFEVVPSKTVFTLSITLENASPQDLQLMSIGLSEFMNGFGFIGGKRSRGLGGCLLMDVKVDQMDLQNAKAEHKNGQLRDFLLNRKFASQIEGQKFLEDHIGALFAEA